MRKHAFTLIELMIVIGIIVFLASISIPKYVNYTLRARQAEVAVNLASLHSAMQMYKELHGKYTVVLNGEDGVGWKPAGYKGGGKQENFYYTYGFYFPGAKEGVHYFTGKLETPPQSLENSFADEEKFVAKAAANLSKDKVDVWQVDEDRRIENVQKGI